jgi:NDP-hexose-3-ketoreductase
LGVIGCADIAVRRTLPAVAAVDGLELVAVAGRDPARTRRCAAAFGAEPVAGYEELLARSDVDAVYVPLPTGLHAHWAERAVRAGKHVLVEKPLATTVAGVETVFGAADAHGVVVMENMTFVHHRQHGVVRDLVRNGAIGELRALTAEFVVPPRQAGDIRLRPDLGGGSLLDQGVYPLRAALCHLGDVEVVSSELRIDRGLGVDVAGRAALRSPFGARAEVAFGMTGPYRARYRLTGSLGTITVNRAFTAPDDHRPVLELTRAGGVERRELAPDQQFARCLEAFRGAVLTRRGVSATTEASRRQARLVEAVRAGALREAAC